MLFRVVSALVLLLPAAAASFAQRPDVVLIVADDLGYGDLSSYGAPDLQTPHIDAIGSRGMRFTQFYANSPVCSPTRAALLFGRYPDMVGVPGEQVDLSDREGAAYEDLAEDLRLHILAAGAVPWRQR